MSRLSRQIVPMGRTITINGAMTEAEWLTCNHPINMWSYLNDGTEAYQFRNGYSVEREQHFVEACNRVCDCPATKPGSGYSWIREPGTECKCTPSIRAHLLREIFANPFRPVVREKLYLTDAAVHSIIFQRAKKIAKNQVTWGIRDDFKIALPTLIFKESWVTQDISSLSQKIYEEQDFELLPILWDMLEERGCDNQQVMEHLRGCEDGMGTCDLHPHVRGCWVLELLRGVK